MKRLFGLIVFVGFIGFVGSSQSKPYDTTYYSNGHFALVKYEKDIISNSNNSTLYRIDSLSNWIKIQDAESCFFDTVVKSCIKKACPCSFQRYYFPDNNFIYAVYERFSCKLNKYSVEYIATSVCLIVTINKKYFSVTLGIDPLSKKAQAIQIAETDTLFKGVKTYASIFTDSIFKNRATFNFGNNIDAYIDFTSNYCEFLFVFSFVNENNEQEINKIFMNKQFGVDSLLQINRTQQTMETIAFYSNSLSKSIKKFKIDSDNNLELVDSCFYSMSGEILLSQPE